MIRATILFVLVLVVVPLVAYSEHVQEDNHEQKREKEADTILQEIKAENDRRRNDGKDKQMWAKLLDDQDLDVKQTYNLIAGIYLTYVDSKSPEGKNLGALLSLLSIDYEKCDVPNVPSESLDKSWLTNPKIARFVDHYRKLKEDGCSWLAMSPEERLAEAIPQQFECQPKSHNFREIFLNSRALLANPDSCDKEMLDLAGFTIDMATCSGSRCCSVQDRPRDMRIDLKYSLHMERSNRKDCINWLIENLDPLVQFAEEAQWLSSQPESLKEAIKPFFSQLGMFTKKRVKLEQLDQLFYEPCQGILEAISKIENGQELITFRYSINSALPQLMKDFRVGWEWCTRNMNDIKLMRKKYTS